MNRGEQLATKHVSDEDVAIRPSPGSLAPSSVCFSPNRKFLTFLLPENSADLATRHLYYVDVSNPSKPSVLAKVFEVPQTSMETEESLSLEDKLRRERAREMNVGVTSYAWSKTGSRLLIPLNGNIFAKETETIGINRDVRTIFDKSLTYGEKGSIPECGALDATLSPDGCMVGFVRNSELYVKSMEPGKEHHSPVQLTFSSCTNVTNGLADFLAQEEMDRYKGFWFSNDSGYVAFEQVDENHIPTYRIVHQGSDLSRSALFEDHHYPFSGNANPKVRLGVIRIADALKQRTNPIWLDLSMSTEEIYLARVSWMPDGSLVAQLQNREQTKLDIVQFDIHTGERTLLLSEETKVWINLHHLFISFESQSAECALGLHGDAANEEKNKTNGFFFVWGSERSGFRHLFLYHFNYIKKETRMVRELTSGDWMVTSLVHVSEKSGLIFFKATKEHPSERHIYAVRMWNDGDSTAKSVVKLSRLPGFNSMVVDNDCSVAAISNESLKSPPIFELCSIDYPTNAIDTIEVGSTFRHNVYNASESPITIPRLISLRPILRPPNIFSFHSRDNERLYGALYKPDSIVYGLGPYPLVVAVYGGPHFQYVQDNWITTADMRAQRLCSEGYAVVKVDNRGSSSRGLAFESFIKNRMGSVEVDDQVDGVNYLVDEGVADRNRVGIYGWSYGGYMSLMCLVKEPNVFHVAVSGAPVTYWEGYDSHYTERYMSTPGKNSEGYKNSMVMTHIHGMKETSKLLIVHGLIDENVHFRHTACLIKSLIKAHKKYDLLLFPDERHSPRKLDDRVYMEQCILDYFHSNLRDKKV